jgi:ferredoxin
MSLLDLAAKHGIAIPYSCRSGSCGTCAVRVLFGSVGYLRKPSAPVAAESCLTCTAYPLESTVLDA